jgi:high-affinity Fe2+/Pb2+ permease
MMTRTYEYPYAENRALRWWGHNAPMLLSLAIAGAILLGFGVVAPGTLSLLLSLTLLLFVLATWVFMRQHDRRLCESCAASIPLNAAEQGQRYRRRFAVTHAASNPKILIPYLIILLGSNALLMVSGGRWVWAAVQSTMIYLVVAHASHRKLQPWCRWCSDGGGGTEVRDDTPDLPRGRGKQLV